MTAPLDLDALERQHRAWPSGTSRGQLLNAATILQLIARVRELEKRVQAANWVHNDQLEAIGNASKQIGIQNRLLAEAERALEHIAQRESRMSCCKFAALSGHRRRHLKETAREALAGIRAAKGAAG